MFSFSTCILCSKISDIYPMSRITIQNNNKVKPSLRDQCRYHVIEKLNKVAGSEALLIQILKTSYSF